MEHRWCDRVESSFDVVLFKDKTPVATCKVSDISMYGVFVKTGPLKYPVNTILVVEFAKNSNKDRKLYRLPVYVVRASCDGLGLAFYNENLETFETARTLIQEVKNIDYVGKSVKHNEKLAGIANFQ